MIGGQVRDHRGRERVAFLRRTLVREGRTHDGTYPWHRTTNPYLILIAELLLKRTKRVVVARVFDVFAGAYPTAADLAAADPDALYERIRPVGLARRTKRLPQVGAAIVANGGVPSDRIALLRFPEVGAYVADATRLYAFSEPCFPLDRNAQRVLRRSIDGCHPDRTVDPYEDAHVVEAVVNLTAGASVGKVRALHQGLLSVAWSHCGPRPRCSGCPLRSACWWALESSAAHEAGDGPDEGSTNVEGGP